MPQPTVPSPILDVRGSSRVKNRALNSDTEAQQSGGADKPESPSVRKRPWWYPDDGLVPRAPREVPVKRERDASPSKRAFTPVTSYTSRPPPPTSSTSSQSLSAGRAADATTTVRSASDPAMMSDLDARIQARINARAQVTRSLAQTAFAPVTPKETGLDAIIRAKIRARADSLGSPALGRPARLAAASPSALSSHHRPPRHLGSPQSRGHTSASPVNSGNAAGIAVRSGPAGGAKRSRQQDETQATSRPSQRASLVKILPRVPVPRVSTPLHARSSDKANLPTAPRLSSSLPANSWLGSMSSPADDLSARIAAKIRGRAVKAEARRLSLGTGAQVTTPLAPAIDPLTAKINAKIQARAQEQAERRLGQGFQSSQTLITESGSPAARLSESGMRSTQGPSPASGPAVIGARKAKADSAKTSNPKKRKSLKANNIKTEQVSAWAPPPGTLGLQGLAPGPSGSRDASPISPHMASPVSSRSGSGPDMPRRSQILSDSESSDSSPFFSPQSHHSRLSLSEQVSHTSTASVSDMLASSPGPFGRPSSPGPFGEPSSPGPLEGPSSPQSELTFLIPSSPQSTVSAAEATPPTADAAAAAATSAAHASLRSGWMHRSPERPGNGEREAKVTGKGVPSTPQLVRAGPRWTVTTPRR